MDFIGEVRHRRIAAALVGATALCLPSCAVAEDSAGAGVSETIEAGVSSSSAEAGIDPFDHADREMKTLRPPEPSQLMVTDVRIGSHAGFDRVVFDLIGEGEPGWFIDYTDAPSQQGSGRGVTFTGDIALNVNIDGTVYPFELGEEDPELGTIPGSGNVTEVYSLGTFEGRSQFVIGLNTPVPYSVQVLDNPQRLVIDLVQ